MKLGFSDAVRLQTDIILIQFADASAKGVKDTRDTIAMSFIQSSIRTNPDEVGEALNDNFVCKNSPQHSKPWATAGKKECGAARVIPDDAVLWVKSFVSHG
jgi:hypothetical protein